MDVLIQACVGPGIHVTGGREDTVAGILFGGCQDSRHEMAFSKCKGCYYFHECALSSLLSYVWI